MLLSLAFSAEQALLFLGAALFLYWTILVLYRLFFSPLAKFPGPKLAAATGLYEFYYDAIKGGKYTFKLLELHAKHGPIIRINPSELHIKDPEFYDELYAGRKDRWSWSSKMFGLSESTFGTLPWDKHRIRRAAIAPFFSRAAVLRLEPAIRVQLDILLSRLAALRDSGHPVNIRDAMVALTVDVITSYSYGTPNGCLQKEDLGREWTECLTYVTRTAYINQTFPLVLMCMEMLPLEVGKRLSKPMTSFLEQVDRVETSVMSLLDAPETKNPYSAQRTIFETLLNSDLPASELTHNRLVDEAIVLVGAGSITTAGHLTFTLTYLLLPENKALFDSLFAEIRALMPNATSPIPPLPTLESSLPLLAATILEAHRLAVGVSHRLQRIDPVNSMQYRDWVIPSGTPVGMTPPHVHYDGTIFPDPEKFDPHRWIGPGAEEKKKFLVPFGRGARQCVGRELAKAEIWLGLVGILSRFGNNMRLVDGYGKEGVEFVSDYFAPQPGKEGEKGVCVWLG